MDKILIYSNNGNILIVANAIDVDPKRDFSYNVANPENCICGMTIQKNRFHFCNRYKRHYLARLQYKKISTTDFQSAMECIDRLVKTATK